MVAQELSAGAKRGRSPRRRVAQVDHPAVAPCVELDSLRMLDAEQAREHVGAYLQAVMPAEDAEAFEADAYRWELHLVELDQIRLVRGVDLTPSRVKRYRAAMNKGVAFPPLIGLGGEGATPTEDTLLCDGYHRVAAMRSARFHFAWMWLAVGLWQGEVETLAVLSGCEA